MQRQQRQRQPNTGTGTTTSTTTSDSESPLNAASFPRTLRLRGESQSYVHTGGDGTRSEVQGGEQEAAEGSASRRVRWDENVVNNEGMGKKSSKVCCIYHKPRAIDESTSESESSSSSSSDDSDTDNGADARARRRLGRHEECDHEHHHDHAVKKVRRKRRPSPNAYERQPRNERRPAQQAKADH